MKIKIMGLLLSLTLLAGVSYSQPYIRTFNVTRTVNVATAGELTFALSAAQAGDQITLADGTYTGTFTATKNDTMIRCNGHCIITGLVRLNGINTWLWGVHVKGTSGNIVEMNASQTVVGNCVVEGDGVTMGQVGIAAFENGYIDQIIYGNIVRNTQHGIYVQHDKLFGTEYVVANYIGDVIPSSNSRSVHVYTESANKTEAFYFLNNIIANGEFLIGGQANATPPLSNEIRNSLFYKAGLNLGYKRPEHSIIDGNLFIKAAVNKVWHWGAGEEIYTIPGPSQFTNNILYNPGVHHFDFKTSAYYGGIRQEGTPLIRPVDIWNNNTFYGLFGSSFYAGGVFHSNVTNINDWRNYTQTAGNRFDNDSTLIATPPPDGYKFIQNEYDSTKALLAVYSFNGSAAVSVDVVGDLRSVVDPFGPVIQTCSGMCAVTLNGQELAAYAVSSTGPPPPPAYTMQMVHDDLDSCLIVAKTKPNAIQKYRYLRDCIQIVVDKIEDVL